MYQTYKSHKRFSKPKLAHTAFTINHYAGDVSKRRSKLLKLNWIIKIWKQQHELVVKQVTYLADQFLDKNKDYVVAEHQALLNASKCPFVANLFPPIAEETSKQSKFSSIGTRFKVWTKMNIIYCFFN